MALRGVQTEKHYRGSKERHLYEKNPCCPPLCIQIVYRWRENGVSKSGSRFRVSGTCCSNKMCMVYVEREVFLTADAGIRCSWIAIENCCVYCCLPDARFAKCDKTANSLEKKPRTELQRILRMNMIRPIKSQRGCGVCLQMQ